MTEQSKVDLQKLADEVALYLGLSWEGTYNAERSWRDLIEIKREDGATVQVWDAGERWGAGGAYPSGYRPYKSNTKDISVAKFRGAKVLAAEICRRLLPDYLPEYAVALDQKRRDEVYRAHQKEAVNNLAAILGTAREASIHLDIPWSKKEPMDPGHTWNPERIFGNVKVISEYYGEITLNLVPVSLLAKILKILRDYSVKGGDAQNREQL